MRALILGGSGGIGKAVSRLLWQHIAHSGGSTLWLHGSTEASAARAAAEIREGALSSGRDGETPAEGAPGSADQAGSELRPVGQHFDAADDWDLLAPRVGDIDVCVVCFGPFLERPLVQTESSEWRRLYELNVVLPARIISALLPEMKQRGFGRIVLFGGTGTDAVRGYREIAAYSAAKTAVGVLVRSAALEIASENVTVNGVCPGLVDTEYIDEKTRSRWAKRMPTGTLMGPEGIAAAVSYLLEPGNRVTNGVLLPVDEGLTAR